MNGKTGSTVMGIGFLVLVLILVFALFRETSTFDDFSKYWGLFGTIVGVVTGAIPSFFFKAEADSAKAEAKKQSEKAEALAGIAEPAAVRQLQSDRSDLFVP